MTSAPLGARRRVRVLGAAVVAAAALAVAVAVSSGGAVDAPSAPTARIMGAASVHRLFAGIPQHGTSLGSPRARVRLVEFADLQCPFCDEYAVRALPTLVRDYVRTGKVQMVFENLSFIGPDSVRAGRVAAAAAAQDKLWDFVELLYLNQGPENTGYATPAFLSGLLHGVGGLDVPAALRRSRTRAAGTALGAADAVASRAGIHATPAFLIGRTRGPQRVFQPSSLSSAPFAVEFDRLLRGQAR
jgi:protein-disulfide isomerase